MAVYKVCINAAKKLAFVALLTEANPLGTVMLGQISFTGPNPKQNATSMAAITTLTRALLASKKIDPLVVFVVVVTGPASLISEADYQDGYNAAFADTVSHWLPTLKGEKGETGTGLKGDKGDKGNTGPVSIVPGPMGEVSIAQAETIAETAATRERSDPLLIINVLLNPGL